MRKSRIILHVFLCVMFLYILNVKMMCNAPSLENAFDLLFLNSRKFPDYSLSPVNLRYLLAVSFMNLIIVYEITSDIAEAPGFVSLLLYRMGRRKTFLYLVRDSLMKTAVVFITIFAAVVGFTFFLGSGIHPEFSQIVYLVRSGLFFSILISTYYYGSLTGKRNNINVLNIVLIIAALTDSFLNTGFAAYSGAWMFEIRMMLIYLAVYAVVLFLCLSMINRKEDL